MRHLLQMTTLSPGMIPREGSRVRVPRPPSAILRSLLAGGIEESAARLARSNLKSRPRSDAPFPASTTLPALVRLIGRSPASAARSRDGLLLLNQFGVEIRYPGATTTPAEARKAVRSMERIVSACRARCPSTAGPKGYPQALTHGPPIRCRFPPEPIGR